MVSPKNVRSISKQKQKEFLEANEIRTNGTTVPRDLVNERTSDELSQLRESKLEWENEERSRGKAEGRVWALNEHYCELRKLNGIIDEYVGHTLTSVPERLGDRDFWQNFFDNEEPNEYYAEGFTRGALMVLDEVDECVF